MINKIKYLCLFLLLVPNIVYAADEVNHIAVIEWFNIRGSYVDVSGYAFLSHQDNYGYDETHGVGNLKTYIVAFSGEWTDDYINPDVCNERQYCYSIPTSVDTTRSMWYARCTDATCTGLTANLQKRGVADLNNLGSVNFINSNSCLNSVYDKVGTQCLYENIGFNASFDLLDVVVDFSGGKNFYNNDINFRIVSINTDIYYGRDVETSGNYKAYGVSNFAVHDDVCTINGSYNNIGGSRSCPTNGSEISAGIYSITLGDFSDFAYFDASLALPRKSDGVADKEANAYFLESSKLPSESKKYKVLNFSPKQKLYKKNSWMDTKKEYYDSLIQLDSYRSDDPYYSSPTKYAIKPAFDGPQPHSDTDIYDYWSASGYLTFDGSLTVKGFSPRYVELSCEQLYNYDWNDETLQAYREKNLNASDLRSVTCEENKRANFLQCKDYSDVKGTIYIKAPIGSNFCTGLNKLEYIRNTTYTSDDGYYLPVTVTADIALEQTGTFIFNPITTQTIKAGTGFDLDEFRKGTFGVAGYETAFEYQGALSWSNKNWLILPDLVEPYYDYSADVYNLTISPGSTERSCTKSSSFNVYNAVEDAGVYYYKDRDGNFIRKTNLDIAVIGALDVSVRGKYSVDFPYENYSHMSADEFSEFVELEDDFGNNLVFESCDSNSVLSECDNEIVDGKWKLKRLSGAIDNSYRTISFDKSTQEVTNLLPGPGNQVVNVYSGKNIEFSFSYYLPDAYVALVDTTYDSMSYSAGEFLYGNKLNDDDMWNSGFMPVGEMYFVSHYYMYDNAFGYDFPFNLVSGTNPSLVNDMNWRLDGTCGVEVKNGLFTPDGPSFKYRSIALENPFPKFAPPVNWADWYSINENKMRLDNTYANGVKYKITISKIEGTINTSIADINNYSKKYHYAMFSNFETDGESKFVMNEIPKIKFDINLNSAKRSFCYSGLYNGDLCDEI